MFTERLWPDQPNPRYPRFGDATERAPRHHASVDDDHPFTQNVIEMELFPASTADDDAGLPHGPTSRMGPSVKSTASPLSPYSVVPR